MIQGYKDFEFDLERALLDHLIDAFNNLDAAPLSTSYVQHIPDEQGLYKLFLDDILVYVGKTDAEAGLNKRLSRHCRKIGHRQNLDPDRVWFKAIRIYVFTPMDLEEQLIKRYGGPKKIAWTNSGFGSNDPGRERDTTAYKEAHFDSQYPIDIDRPVTLATPDQPTAAAVLRALRKSVPYTVRFQSDPNRKNRAHHDLDNTEILFDCSQPASTRSIIRNVISALPTGWQATALPSHVIIYKEDRDYEHGEVIARS